MGWIIVIILVIIGIGACGDEMEKERNNQDQQTIRSSKTFFAESNSCDDTVAYNNEDYRVLSYDVFNNSSSYILELKLQHETSNFVTTVDLWNDPVPRYAQEYRNGVNINGVRNSSDTAWKNTMEKSLQRGLDGFFETTFYTGRNVVIRGVARGKNIITGGGCYLTVVWRNGTVKRFYIPYTCADIRIYDDYVISGIFVPGEPKKQEYWYPL